jgi:hypothetical protein
MYSLPRPSKETTKTPKNVTPYRVSFMFHYRLCPVKTAMLLPPKLLSLPKIAEHRRKSPKHAEKRQQPAEVRRETPISVEIGQNVP